VRVHDYVRVKRDILDRAESEVTTILHKAGIYAAWVDCPLTSSELDQYPACLAAEHSAYLDMIIVPHFMATRWSMPDTTLGFTPLSKDGERAYQASVFYDRVREEAEISRGSLTVILGHAMAHELGHLLLRTCRHSSEGIMRAKWNFADLHRAAQGHMGFTPQQAEQMRAEVSTRIGMQQADAVPETAARK
jgi:hypothetical protein